MQPDVFAALNSKHAISSATYFNQALFRCKARIPTPRGLCSALVQLWWAAREKGEDWLTVPLTPGLAQEVIFKQSRSLYCTELSFTDETRTDIDQAWLRFKYNCSTVRDVESLRKKYCVSDLLELDLVLQHRALIAGRQYFSADSSDIVAVLTDKSATGLRLLLLRYYSAEAPDRQVGHRIAFLLSSDCSCRLFDPACGEVTFDTPEPLTNWFPEYWQASRYDQYTQHAMRDIPPVTIYTFGPPVDLDDVSVPGQHQLEKTL